MTIGRRQWPHLILSVLMGLLAFPCQADSLRCPQGIITTGDDKATVLQKCGEPVLEKTVARLRQKEKTRMHFPATRPRIRENLVEHWTYHMGVGKFQRVLVFEAGWLTRINHGPRQ